jgi:sec-independent protein translocase protein TatC
MADDEAVADGRVVARLTPDPAAAAPVPAPASEPGDAPAPAAATGAGEMSLVDHLVELRDRIVRVILAVVVGSAVGFWFWKDIRNVLLNPLPTATVQVLGPGDAFMIALRIAIVAGIILAMPVILWQVWGFVAPGLTESERRTVRPWIPLALVFFAIGVAIAYLILPFAVGFLLSFTDDRLVGNLAAGPYFDFVTTMFLAFGLILEFPIVLYGLSRVGIVTSKRLASSRRVAILAIAVFAAGITPGGDLVSPFVLGGTMYVLFEGTIVFIRRSGK